MGLLVQMRKFHGVQEPVKRRSGRTCFHVAKSKGGRITGGDETKKICYRGRKSNYAHKGKWEGKKIWGGFCVIPTTIPIGGVAESNALLSFRLWGTLKKERKEGGTRDLS